MGWRDFQAAPPQEFMESMESMTVATPLITLIPFIPKEAVQENREIINSPVKLPRRGACAELPPDASTKQFWTSWTDMTTGEVIGADTEPRQPVSIFEATGDPASCRFWKQVCWAVDFYQDACTRNSSCKIHKFLEANLETS